LTLESQDVYTVMPMWVNVLLLVRLVAVLGLGAPTLTGWLCTGVNLAYALTGQERVMRRRAMSHFGPDRGGFVQLLSRARFSGLGSHGQPSRPGAAHYPRHGATLKWTCSGVFWTECSTGHHFPCCKGSPALVPDSFVNVKVFRVT
uniref:ABC transmembrane type-1 domain-containing protein n=1 Tax=Macrostomum lignano TaxID=282301 RepID=A0A1I8FFS0_9PLAT